MSHKNIKHFINKDFMFCINNHINVLFSCVFFLLFLTQFSLQKRNLYVQKLIFVEAVIYWNNVFFKKCNLQTKQTVFTDFIIWNKSFIIFSVNFFPLHFLIQALNKWIFPLYMINSSRQFDTCCNCKTSKAIDVQVSTIYWLISNSSIVTCRWKYVVLIILFFY